jgi:hypothetical protein
VAPRDPRRTLTPAPRSDQTRPPHVAPATPSRFDASERPSLRLFGYENRHRGLIIHSVKCAGSQPGTMTL